MKYKNVVIRFLREIVNFRFCCCMSMFSYNMQNRLTASGTISSSFTLLPCEYQLAAKTNKK